MFFGNPVSRSVFQMVEASHLRAQRLRREGQYPGFCLPNPFVPLKLRPILISTLRSMKSTSQSSFFWRHIGLIFMAPLFLGFAALYMEFFPSRTWGIFSGALTFVAALATLPQIFSERARTVISRSANPALMRKGQWTLGIGGILLLWVSLWLALCQLGGSAITYALGAPHSESIGATLDVRHRRLAIGCHYAARLAEYPNRWGNEICVSSDFYNNGPRYMAPMQLHGTLSPLGFKVKSYQR